MVLALFLLSSLLDAFGPSRPSGLLTTKEVAAFLAVPVGTVRDWRYRRVGPRGVRLGRRVLYRQAVVEQWLEEREREDPSF